MFARFETFKILSKILHENTEISFQLYWLDWLYIIIIVN